MSRERNPPKTSFSRSLGSLRKNPEWTKGSRSPEALGKLRIRREHLEAMYNQLQETGEPVIEGRLAIWMTLKKRPDGTLDGFISLEFQSDPSISFGSKPRADTLKRQGLETFLE